MEDDLEAQKQTLLALVNTRMPYGKYKGLPLVDLPEPYLVWFHHKGFPKGELGQLLGLMHEIKCNGLESLLTPLRSPHDESIP
jgi:uncharacterized protein (DUF3820 family)